MGVQDWYKEKADKDRAEVIDWFRSKTGQRALWIVFGGLAAWLVVSSIWSAL